MKKIKILFLIPNLGHGGAEKVLVNLVNNMNKEKFDITVMCLYNEGVNKQFLNDNIKFKYCFKKSFKGVSHILKLFSPSFLYKNLVNEKYDIVVSYLEGQTARIVSGCNDKNVKKICWIHKTMTTLKDASRLFRNNFEAQKCYSQFDKIVSVSEDVQKAFMNIFHLDEKGYVLYNVNDTDKIIEMSNETANIEFDNKLNMFAMGTLFEVKGFDRLIRIHKRLLDDEIEIHTYILGEGPDEQKILNLIKLLKVEDTVTLLGYQKNPYKYLAQADLFVCSSYSEGFSTAATEALILGVPVVATNVSGMKELLGDNDYGMICNNDEDSLYFVIKDMIENQKLNYYKVKAEIRGEDFTKESIMTMNEEFFLNL